MSTAKAYKAFFAKLKPKLARDANALDLTEYEANQVDEIAAHLVAALSPDQIVSLTEKLSSALDSTANAAMDAALPNQHRLQPNRNRGRVSLSNASQFPHASRLVR